MTDIVDRQTRSRMMSGIQGKDTRPERIIRSELHRRGFRFRLHSRDLPGKPDLVFRSRNAVIFVNGCFWHGHRCHLFKWPATRQQWWRDKIGATRKRDRNVVRQLQAENWRVLTVWECALKGKHRLPLDNVADRIARWLEGSVHRTEITGLDTRSPRRKK